MQRVPKRRFQINENEKVPNTHTVASARVPLGTKHSLYGSVSMFCMRWGHKNHNIFSMGSKLRYSALENTAQREAFKQRQFGKCTGGRAYIRTHCLIHAHIFTRACKQQTHPVVVCEPTFSLQLNSVRAATCHQPLRAIESKMGTQSTRLHLSFAATTYYNTKLACTPLRA